MSQSSNANDTFNAVDAACTAAHALKDQCDGYATTVEAEGGHEAAEAFQAMSAAIASAIGRLDTIRAALYDNKVQNS